MRDYSLTEMESIDTVFRKDLVRRCHLHVKMEIRKNVTSKIGFFDLPRESAMAETSSVNISLLEYQLWKISRRLRFQTQSESLVIIGVNIVVNTSYQDWMNYLSTFWLKHPEKLWCGNRKVGES